MGAQGGVESIGAEVLAAGVAQHGIVRRGAEGEVSRALDRTRGSGMALEIEFGLTGLLVGLEIFGADRLGSKLTAADTPMSSLPSPRSCRML